MSVLVDITGAGIGAEDVDLSDLSQFVTKQQAESLYVNAPGDSMSGNLDMVNNKIINLADPTNSTDATNKQFTENADNITSGTVDKDRLPSTLNQTTVKEKLIITKQLPYADSVGISITGILDMNDNRIANVANPVNGKDSVNKDYANNA